MHSFVDLITNSSTELYIEATEKTIESIKNLIDKILQLGDSKLKCDDLFTVELDPENVKEAEEYSRDYKNISLLVKSRDESSSLGKETAKVLSSLPGLFSIESTNNY